jgi:hypothetical protein
MVGDASSTGDASRGFDLDLVALAVSEGHRERRVSVALCDREGGGGVESATQEHDGFCHRTGLWSSSCKQISPTGSMRRKANIRRRVIP